MPIALRAKVSGGPQTFDFLRNLQRRIGDVRTPLRAFGRVMFRSIAENFEQEGRPLAWKRLAPSTREQRRGAGAFAQILQDKGTLKGSIRFAVEGNTLRIGPSGPAAVYGRIHQLGGQAGRGQAVTIPARPYLVFQDEDLEEARELIERYVLGGRRQV